MEFYPERGSFYDNEKGNEKEKASIVTCAMESKLYDFETNANKIAKGSI